MRSVPRPPSEDLSAPSLWAMLMRSWLRVMIVAGLVGAMTFAALPWFTQPQYAAIAELEVPERSAAAAVELLRSRELGERLVAELGLARDPAFNTAMPSHALGRLMQAAGLRKSREGDTTEERALVTYLRSLRVEQSSDGRRVTVEFSAPGPQLAVSVAERLVDMYLEDPAEAAPPAGEAADVEQLARAAAEADAVVERFRSATGIAARTTGAPETETGNLAEAVAQARRERDAAEARARAVRALLDKGTVEAIPEIHPSPALHELIAERVRVEVQKTGAERSLPAGHPRVRELQVKLSELRWQMFREATTIAEALDSEAATAATREGDARTRLDHATAGARDAAADAAKLATLERDAAEKHAALNAAQSGREKAAPVEAQEGGVSTPSLVAPVQASAAPVWPRKGPLSLLAAVSTLMIGFVLVIIRELAVNARHMPVGEVAERQPVAPERAETMAGGRPAAVPNQREPAATSPAMVAPPAAQTSHFAALTSIGDAARHIAAVAAERRGFRTLVVGDGIDGAGEARELVSTLASTGRRSVLVDWSRDGNGIATSLGLLPGQPGINDLLAGRATFEDIIARLPESDAHVVASGAPAVVGMPLDPDWINLVLDALDEAYDHVVIVSRLEPARALFEATEGRFDTGILVSDRRAQGMNINAAPGVFLGFEVTDIEVVQLDVAQRSAIPQRRARRGRRQAAVA